MDLYNLILTAKIQKGGGSEVVDGIITRNISGSLYNSTASFIGDHAFYNCKSITTVDFPNATSIGSYAFNSCSKLTSVDFPSVTSIGSYAFNGCYELTTANFPNATSIGSYAFAACSKLTSVNFTKATSIYSYAFANCKGLTTVNFPNMTSIGSYAFNYCISLMSLYLPQSSVAILANINAFYCTPMSLSSYTGAFGSIYVPASLVSDYKVAAKWSTYSSRITSYVE